MWMGGSLRGGMWWRVGVHEGGGGTTGGRAPRVTGDGVIPEGTLALAFPLTGGGVKSRVSLLCSEGAEALPTFESKQLLQVAMPPGGGLQGPRPQSCAARGDEGEGEGQREGGLHVWAAHPTLALLARQAPLAVRDGSFLDAELHEAGGEGAGAGVGGLLGRGAGGGGGDLGWVLGDVDLGDSEAFVAHSLGCVWTSVRC